MLVMMQNSAGVLEEQFSFAALPAAFTLRHLQNATANAYISLELLCGRVTYVSIPDNKNQTKDWCDRTRSSLHVKRWKRWRHSRALHVKRWKQSRA